MGLIIAGGLTLLAFEWTSPVTFPVLPKTVITDTDDGIELPPLLFSEAVKKPEVKVIPQKVNLEVIEIIKDETPTETTGKTEDIPEILTLNLKDLTPPEIIIDEDIPSYGAEVMPEFIGGLEKMKELRPLQG